MNMTTHAHSVLPWLLHSCRELRIQCWKKMEGYVERVVEARRREVAKALSRSSIGESVEVHRPLADLIIDRSVALSFLFGFVYMPMGLYKWTVLSATNKTFGLWLL